MYSPLLIPKFSLFNPIALPFYKGSHLGTMAAPMV